MRRPPPPFTAQVAASAAAAYLQTRFTTRSHLRRLILHRADRAIAEYGGDRAEAAAIVDALLDRLVESGQLNDAAYANAKVEKLVRAGVAPPVIHGRLAAKGVSGALVRAGLDAMREDGIDPALSGAAAYARRRRIGPFRLDAEQRAAERPNDLARMARAGYSYDIAKKIINLADEDEARALLDGL